MPKSAVPTTDSAETPTSTGGSRSIYLETFGCQMNELDSELVQGQLAALGYRFTDDAASADIVLYNTCSVREQAENKVWSRVGIHGIEKKSGAKMILGVIGCMAEREGPAMMRKFPQIDLMCGPGELDRLPLLLDNACKTQAVDRADRIALQGNTNRRSATLSAAGDNLEMLDLSRAFSPDQSNLNGRSAYVRITRGCNKFCTYCVVPYTRGAEVHRPPQSIIDECKRLADQGVIEITLLGQTVNHYVYTHGAAVSTDGMELPQVGPGAGAFSKNGAKTQALNGINPKSGFQNRKTTSFADLLHQIHEQIPTIRRLRFVTSFPRDFGDDILQVIATSSRICKYLHVPAQSGSDRILKLMNRGYTSGEYLDFIRRAREIIPDVTIAGDFIVGFPTETDADFQATVDLLRTARYKNSFIFKYSPRPGTIAIDRLADDVPDNLKRTRNSRLLAVQAEVSTQVHAEWVGRVVDVLVDRIDKKPARQPGRPANGTVELTLGGRGRVSEGRSQRSEVRSQKSAINCHSASANAMLAPSSPRRVADGDLKPQAPSLVSLSGRTPGDLIVAFDAPSGQSDAIGRIFPVKIFSSAPLLLRGQSGGE